jgi:hypothetical protein
MLMDGDLCLVFAEEATEYIVLVSQLYIWQWNTFRHGLGGSPLKRQSRTCVAQSQAVQPPAFTFCSSLSFPDKSGPLSLNNLLNYQAGKELYQ